MCRPDLYQEFSITASSIIASATDTTVSSAGLIINARTYFSNYVPVNPFKNKTKKQLEAERADRLLRNSWITAREIPIKKYVLVKNHQNLRRNDTKRAF